MTTRSWMVLGGFLMLAGCGGTGVDEPFSELEDESELKPSTCGDGVCRKRETCSSCPKDCGVCSTPTPTTGYTCASFEGLTVNAPNVSYQNVYLRSGETITARASNTSAGDRIILSVGAGFNFTFLDAAASTGIAFTGSGASYNFGWSLDTVDGSGSMTRTWTFDCSAL